MTGLRSLVRNFADAPIVVWLNPYFGDIIIDNQNFYGFKTYVENPGAFQAVVEIPPLNPGTFGRDLAELLAKRWSFEAAVASSRLPLMTRQRLATTWRDLEASIEKSFVM